MVAVRVAYTDNSDYTNLVWNLFLAWIPFAIAIYVYEGYRRDCGRVRLWAAGALWLVFFPNAPYIVTDFKWLRELTGAPLWYDVVLVSAAAWCGLLLGFMSLYLMQALCGGRRRPLRAWAFANGTLALGSFGVYLGRFQRWNSWICFTQPRACSRTTSGPASRRIPEHPKPLRWTVSLHRLSRERRTSSSTRWLVDHEPRR